MGKKKEKKKRKKLTDEIRRDLELVLEVFCIKYFYIYCLFVLWCGRCDIIIVILFFFKILVGSSLSWCVKGNLFFILKQLTPSDDTESLHLIKNLHPFVSSTQLSALISFIQSKVFFFIFLLSLEILLSSG